MRDERTWFVDDEHLHLHCLLSEVILQSTRIESAVTALDFGHEQFGNAVFDRDLSIAIGSNAVGALGESDIRHGRADEWHGDLQIFTSTNDDLFRTERAETNGMRSHVRWTSLNRSIGLS